MKRPALLLLALAVLALIIVIARAPAAAARGWLSAFVLVSTVPIGSLALLLVHGITGGRWGEDLKPALVPAARCIPLLLIAFAPILLFRSTIYDWREIGVPDDVRALYLSPAFFDLRAVAALAIWSALAWLNPWRRELLAAIALVVHLVLLSFIPADWVLTLKPQGISAGFGFGFGCEQIFAALGYAAWLARQGSEPRASRDLVGILVTALLASMYFIYMQFLIVWYGNVPAKVHWYTARAGDGWSAVALVAFLLGVVIPFGAILNRDVRQSPAALRPVGACVLGGIALHVAWMTLPAFGAPVAVPMVLAALALTAALTAAAAPMSQFRVP
jgi:hypothetical protein